MDEPTIRSAVLTAHQYSYLHGDWVNPLQDALGGLTAVEAWKRPGPEVKGVWDIVLHVAYHLGQITKMRELAGAAAGPGS